MSLSTHVKRISLNQWRYYYNQLLFVDAPLSANFMQGLILPKGNSPAIEITPITVADEIPEETYGKYLEPLLLEKPTFGNLKTQLPCQSLYQRLVINIYSNTVLNKEANSCLLAAGEWPEQTVTDATSPLHPAMEFTEGCDRSMTTTTGVFSTPISPVRSKVEIPEPLCQVSALLAGFITR